MFHIFTQSLTGNSKSQRNDHFYQVFVTVHQVLNKPSVDKEKQGNKTRDILQNDDLLFAARR